jgi:hypothetical protein
MPLIFDMIATKDQLPEVGQRCLIRSLEIDKLIFGYHAHGGYFDYAYPGGIMRIYADYWANEPRFDLQFR